jgi:acetyltransferase-like isoleucine patch superfamily enzyme
MAMLSRTAIDSLGFKYVGKDVSISDKASFYNCKNITIDDQTRIDDFCILSAGDGGIAIGRYVHIAAHCSLIGAGKITMEDFSGLSSRVSIHSSNDDYSGSHMTNPTVPKKFTNVRSDEVFLSKHVIVGSGAVILPGVRLELGVVIGALSLVTKNCSEFGVYSGVPARLIKKRSNELLDLERQLAQENQAPVKR